jgi:protein subunit release factor A
MEKQILDKLIQIKEDYSKIQEQLMNPEVHSDVKLVTSLNKNEKKLRNKVELYDK